MRDRKERRDKSRDKEAAAGERWPQAQGCLEPQNWKRQEGPSLRLSGRNQLGTLMQNPRLLLRGDRALGGPRRRWEDPGRRRAWHVGSAWKGRQGLR